MHNKIINCLNFSMDSSTRNLLTVKIQLALEEKENVSAEEIFDKLELNCPEETKNIMIENIEEILKEKND